MIGLEIEHRIFLAEAACTRFHPGGHRAQLGGFACIEKARQHGKAATRIRGERRLHCLVGNILV
jgi:hypothetical protein